MSRPAAVTNQKQAQKLSHPSHSSEHNATAAQPITANTATTEFVPWAAAREDSSCGSAAAGASATSKLTRGYGRLACCLPRGEPDRDLDRDLDRDRDRGRPWDTLMLHVRDRFPASGHPRRRCDGSDAHAAPPPHTV